MHHHQEYDFFSNDDVATEILSRLPLKSLFKFRTINKSWRHTIDSSSFRKLHAENQLLSNNVVHDDPLLLQSIHHSNESSELSIMHVDAAKPYTATTNFPSYQDFLNDNATAVFSQPVHGLICLYKEYSDNPIALCNPTLGEIRILPPSPSPCPSPHRRKQVVGLGYDGDFKVVKFSHDDSSSPSQRYPILEVYSRKTDTWRVLPVHKISYELYKPIQHVEPPWLTGAVQ